MVRRLEHGFFLVELMICFVVLTLCIIVCMHINKKGVDVIHDTHTLLDMITQVEHVTCLVSHNTKDQYVSLHTPYEIIISQPHTILFLEQGKSDNEIVMLKQKIVKVRLKRKTSSAVSPYLEWMVITV